MVLKIDPSAVISGLSDIEDSRIGTRIEIGPHTLVDSFVKIKAVGGRGDLVIGRRCFLNSGVVIYTGNGVRIGDHVLIAANCTLAPVNHRVRDRNRLILEQGFEDSRGGIEIGSDVWLGANCVVLDGARVGEGSVVGAGSVVRSDLEPYGIYGGSPLRRLGDRNG
jgi:virginiamycin A acetyltransferase